MASYFSKKTPKSEAPDKGPLTIYNPHTYSLEYRQINWTQNYYRIVSIDPGRKNLSMRIELRPKDTLHNKIITEVAFRIDLGDPKTDEINNECDIYSICNNVLDKYLELMINSHFVIIERQLPVNYRMVRLSQHIVSYFLFKLQDNLLQTIIMEVDPKLKSKELDAPKNLNKKGIKAWAIEKAIELCKIRDDKYCLDIMEKAGSKKDDISDTLVQIEAVFIYLGLPITKRITSSMDFFDDSLLMNTDSSGNIGDFFSNNEINML